MKPFGTSQDVVLPSDPKLLEVIINLTVRAVTEIMVANHADISVVGEPFSQIISYTSRQASFNNIHEMNLGFAFVSRLIPNAMLRFHLKTTFTVNDDGSAAVLSWSSTPLGSSLIPD